jgi:hypothetical protein
MILYQKKGEYQNYIGWYGMCGEDGTVDVGNVEADCQTFNMHTGGYEDSSYTPINPIPKWIKESSEDGMFRDHVVQVSNVSPDRIQMKKFNMSMWYEYYEMFKPSLGAVGATNFVDSMTYEFDAGLNRDETNGRIHEFVRMQCGKAYSIIVKPANDVGYGRGDVVRQFDIPEFYYTTVAGAGTTYRLTAECCY